MDSLMRRIINSTVQNEEKLSRLNERLRNNNEFLANMHHFQNIDHILDPYLFEFSESFGTIQNQVINGRIYVGVHLRDTCVAGQALGRGIGGLAASRVRRIDE